MKLLIKLANYLDVVAEKQFTVILTECEPTIEPATAPEDVTYEINSPALTTAAFGDFTYTPAACLFEFTYSAKLESGEPLPNFIKFDAD